MKKLLQISILLLAAFMSSCNDGDPGPARQDGTQGTKGDKGDTGDKGDQGEPGASGELKSGFITGTITGTRRDHTTFEQTFKYENVVDADGFNSNNVLSVSRQSEDPGRTGYASMQLAFTEKSDPSLPIYLNNLDFSFSKELSVSELFAFNSWVSNSQDPTTVRFPLSTDLNVDYQIDYQRAFDTNVDGVLYYDALTDDNSFVFYTLNGNVVHYDAIHSQAAGDYKKYALLKVTDAAGNEIADGVFAGTNYYAKNIGRGSYIEDQNGVNMSGIEIWDFSESISDYHYNATTGIATFNYSISIPAPLNSSGHVASISGSVEAKIYDKIASRTARGN